MNHVVNGTCTAIKYIDAAVVAATNDAAATIVKSHVPHPELTAWNSEGFNPLRTGELVQGNTFRNVIEENRVFFNIQHCMTSAPS